MGFSSNVLGFRVGGLGVGVRGSGFMVWGLNCLCGGSIARNSLNIIYPPLGFSSS